MIIIYKLKFFTYNYVSVFTYFSRYGKFNTVHIKTFLCEQSTPIYISVGDELAWEIRIWAELVHIA
jgi:hypothetical protein